MTRRTLLGWGRDAELAAGMRRALQRGQIQVHYQPQVSLATGDVVGLEALARWVHPSRGAVPPDEFIPTAERTGVVTAIDAHVLHEATQQLARWTALGLSDLTVAVNLSAASFRDPGLLTDVATAVHASCIPPERLHLEITESAVTPDIAFATERIARLRGLGVRVAIDDFGVRQSSLSYLHQCGVDMVKIDRSFIRDVVRDVRVTCLVDGMLKLFRHLGVTVVAEGISHAEQLEHLREAGCELGQGFHVGRPAAADLTTIRLQQARTQAEV